MLFVLCVSLTGCSLFFAGYLGSAVEFESVATSFTTKTSVLQAYGEPNSRETVNGKEVWLYRVKNLPSHDWHVALIGVGIPIPIIWYWPHENLKFAFDDNKVAAYRSVRRENGAFCGFTSDGKFCRIEP